MNPDQPRGEGETTKWKRANQSRTDGDQQSGESSINESVSEAIIRRRAPKIGCVDEVKTSRRYDRDRHGERRRPREGRCRYFHKGTIMRPRGGPSGPASSSRLASALVVAKVHGSPADAASTGSV